ncbi:MAG: hypothetical protein ACXWT1_02555 [Methylobacter sp.]
MSTIDSFPGIIIVSASTEMLEPTLTRQFLAHNFSFNACGVLASRNPYPRHHKSAA